MSNTEIIVSVISSILSLILGWYGREWMTFLKMAAYARDAKSIRSFLQGQGNQALIDYYVTQGEGQFLYTLGSGKKSPVLTKPGWYGDAIYERRIVFSDSGTKVQAPKNRRAIARRLAIGEKIWDGAILCLSGISESKDKLTINVSRGTYFQYITVADTQLRELFRNHRRSRRRISMRSRAARSIFELESGSLRAQIVGMGVAVVLNVDGTYKILIQRRSNSTGIAAGRLTVVPCVTFSTDMVEFDAPSVDLLPLELRIFLVEFFEELYNQEELIKDSKYVSLDWFYSENPIRELLEMRKSGEFTFSITGISIDGFTGELHIAAIALLTDPQLGNSLVRSMKRNWEIDSIELVDVFGEDLKARIHSDDMYPTGAFGIERALDYLRTRGLFTHAEEDGMMQ